MSVADTLRFNIEIMGFGTLVYDQGQLWVHVTVDLVRVGDVGDQPVFRSLLPSEHEFVIALLASGRSWVFRSPVSQTVTVLLDSSGVRYGSPSCRFNRSPICDAALWIVHMLDKLGTEVTMAWMREKGAWTSKVEIVTDEF